MRFIVLRCAFVQLIETRLFKRYPDGVWADYTYEWNAAQTEATRVTAGKE